MSDLDELVKFAIAARDAATELERQLALNAVNVLVKRLAQPPAPLAMGSVSRK